VSHALFAVCQSAKGGSDVRARLRRRGDCRDFKQASTFEGEQWTVSGPSTLVPLLITIALAIITQEVQPPSPPLPRASLLTALLSCAYLSGVPLPCQPELVLLPCVCPSCHLSRAGATVPEGCFSSSTRTCFRPGVMWSWEGGGGRCCWRCIPECSGAAS
jgi:hypothetical protein